MTINALRNPPMLRPLGGPVEFHFYRGTTSSVAHKLPTIPDDRRSFATVSALLAKQPNARDVVDRLITVDATEELHDHLDDAARRVSPANSPSIDVVEHAIEKINGYFDDVEKSVVILPGADRIDAASLRLIAAAWSRRTHRIGARLILEICDTLPDRIETAYDASRWITLSGVATALHTECRPMIAEPSVQARGASPTFREAMQAFRQRNYEHASNRPAETPDDCLIQALVASRCDQLQLALLSLDEMERISACDEDRARACSTRAVMIAKLGKPNALPDAMSAVLRGLKHIESKSAPDAIGQRGWLFNNAGFLAVRTHLYNGNLGKLDHASGWLRLAMQELARLPADHFRSLKYNVLANTVQLLEMQGRFQEAIDLLERSFSATEHPSYHYRFAVLAKKVGRCSESLRALDRAEQLCTRREWPFLEHIERARGAFLFHAKNFSEAAECFHRGFLMCCKARAMAASAHHGMGLLACLLRQRKYREADDFKRMCDDDGLILPLLHEQMDPPRPAGKLPPHIPELDLFWPTYVNHNWNNSQITESRS